MLFTFAQGLDHRGFDALGECAHCCVIPGFELRRPGTDQHLIEQVFGVTAGHRLAVDLAAVAPVEAQPMRHPPPPFARHLRQESDAEARVLAALGVVRRRRQHPARP